MQVATIIGTVVTQASTTGGPIGSYTVPANTSAVISHIAITNAGTNTPACVVTATNGTLSAMLGSLNLPAGGSVQILGVTEVTAGIILGPITLAAGWYINVAVTGAQLDAIYTSMSVTQFA